MVKEPILKLPQLKGLATPFPDPNFQMIDEETYYEAICGFADRVMSTFVRIYHEELRHQRRAPATIPLLTLWLGKYDGSSFEWNLEGEPMLPFELSVREFDEGIYAVSAMPIDDQELLIWLKTVGFLGERWIRGVNCPPHEIW